MTTNDDFAALRALVDAVTKVQSSLDFHAEPGAWLPADFVKQAEALFATALPAAMEALERVELLVGELRQANAAIKSAFSVQDQLRARLDRLEEYVSAEAGFDCRNYDKHLSPKPCGACSSCRARAALEGR